MEHTTMDRRADLALSVGVLLFGVFLFVAARNINIGQISDPVGSRGVPTFVGLVFMAGGMALIYRRLSSWRSERGPFVASDGAEDEPGYPASARRAFAIVGVSFLYALLLPILGFPLATPALLAALMWILGLRSARLLGFVSVGYTLFVYLTFTQALSVNLPAGFLSDALDALGLG